MSRDTDKHLPDDLPIPTYEEAIASRPPSSLNHLGPSEPSDDAERQGLLSQNAATQTPSSSERRQRDGRGNYRAPAVESERSSYDSALTSPRVSDEEEDAALRRDMEEMEVVEGDAAGSGRGSLRHRARLRLPKSLLTLRQQLSAISLPSLPRPRFVEGMNQRLPQLPPGWHVGWPIVARLVGLFVLISFVYSLVVFKVFSGRQNMIGQHYLPDSVRSFVQGAVDPVNIQKYLYEMSYDDHIAGTKGDFFLAQRMYEYFMDARLDGVWNDNYEVYLNYPRPEGRRVAIVDPPELRYDAKLEEDLVPGKEEQHQSPVFHGHSKGDNVTGPLVYANYGSREDFARLADAGVNVTGAIALVRYYGTQGDRALKVKAAEMAGAAGCLIYSDPADDGFAKGPTYPDGPWRPADSVQRGAVSLMSWVVGDVLTPGWASTTGADRLAVKDSPGLVNIPSLPLAWRDAKPLLEALKGHGHRAWDEWVGGQKEIEWWTGDQKSPTAHLMNLQDENAKQPIRNVIGKIQGLETPEKTVYVGNHRDAWCFGAVDPGSGTAVFLEVVRVFGELLQLGWRPRRTIVFASWDGEEYNLIGSTEHVEERIEQLRRDGIAYLNVDSAVSGHQFWADASPLFLRPLHRVLERVGQPGENKTLLKQWQENGTKLGGLGAGSDYVAFQDLAGTSSIDFGFAGEPAAYPYHSCYDSFDWMTSQVDKDFTYHATMARIWALLILEIADEAIIGFDFPFYASEVQRYIDDLAKYIEDGKAAKEEQKTLNLKSLRDAANSLTANAEKFMEYEDNWTNLVGPTMLESRATAIRRISHNTRMSDFETFLLDLPDEDEDREGGIPGRTQFKHVLFGPQLWSGYEEAYFPGVRDMVEKGDWAAAQEQVDIAATRLGRAAYKLVY